MSALKLGTQTGSFVNHLYSSTKSKEPLLGGGATILSWTDRTAATITSIIRNNKGKVIEIGVTHDEVTPLHKGLTDCQEYTYAPGKGREHFFTIRKTGDWVRKGEALRNGQRITIGVRDHYYDPHF